MVSILRTEPILISIKAISSTRPVVPYSTVLCQTNIKPQLLKESFNVDVFHHVVIQPHSFFKLVELTNPILESLDNYLFVLRFFWFEKDNKTCYIALVYAFISINMNIRHNTYKAHVISSEYQRLNEEKLKPTDW